MTSKVRVSVGMTLKLAEFQFVRVYLDIERDCDPDMEIEAIDAKVRQAIIDNFTN